MNLLRVPFGERNQSSTNEVSPFGTHIHDFVHQNQRHDHESTKSTANHPRGPSSIIIAKMVCKTTFCNRQTSTSTLENAFTRNLLTLTVRLQVRYAAHAIPPAKSARSRGSYLRVSFKNTRETAQAINGWKLHRAVKYLENVMQQKEAVPMRRYAGGTGRSAQGKNYPMRRIETQKFRMKLCRGDFASIAQHESQNTRMTIHVKLPRVLD